LEKLLPQKASKRSLKALHQFILSAVVGIINGVFKPASEFLSSGCCTAVGFVAVVAVVVSNTDCVKNEKKNKKENAHRWPPVSWIEQASETVYDLVWDGL
jgi:hypothetical protein